MRELNLYCWRSSYLIQTKVPFLYTKGMSYRTCVVSYNCGWVSWQGLQPHQCACWHRLEFSGSDILNGSELNGVRMSTPYLGDFFSPNCNCYLLSPLAIIPCNPLLIRQVSCFPRIANVSQSRVARAMSNVSVVWWRVYFVWVILVGLWKVWLKGDVGRLTIERNPSWARSKECWHCVEPQKRCTAFFATRGTGFWWRWLRALALLIDL